MTEKASTAPVGAADIDAAARVVAPFAVRTPLLSFPVLNERVGTKVFLKPEMLQRTGSFKFRGAFNKLASIPQDKRAGGWSRFRPAITPRAWPRRLRSFTCRPPS
jgi:threonine dehydratase